MEYSYIDASAASRADWEAICKPGGYAVVSGSELPAPVPPELAAKADSVVVIASASADGTCYFVANIHRVDENDVAIDQNPLGVMFFGAVPAPSGVIIQHGTWVNRTIPMPSNFMSYIASSGIGNHFPLSEIPEKRRGSIDELRVPSQWGAFDAVLSELQKARRGSTA